VVIFLEISRTPVFFTQIKRGLIMNAENDNAGNQIFQEDDLVKDANDNEDVINLTDMVEKPSEGEKDDTPISDEEEKEAISLDTIALEEEEIVELVDAGDEEESDQDIFMEGVDPEKDLEPGVISAPEDDEEGLEISLDFEDGASEEGLIPTDFEGDLEPDMEALGGRAQDEYSKDDAQQVMPSQVTGEPADTDVLKGLSDEKLEAIVTRVVEQTIEEKAERILLDVAKAAVSKEIEKIKQAL